MRCELALDSRYGTDLRIIIDKFSIVTRVKLLCKVMTICWLINEGGLGSFFRT
ncbi:hypothetical protein [uncultured Clostridium sp.]|uniref:hypothetical protein n=1 Tax=uncultured Clostridium sp. TaxID=59620 RepID=UPI0026353C98|nr:hypothetical protein [uncultured Clostridium sp.]